MIHVTDVIIKGLIRTVTTHNRWEHHGQQMHLHHHTHRVAYEILDGAMLQKSCQNHEHLPDVVSCVAGLRRG